MDHPRIQRKAHSTLRWTSHLHELFESYWTTDKRLRECGVFKAWVESCILWPNSTKHALAGKAYNKTMRSHKFSTFQALWRILFPALESFLQDVQFMETITALMSSNRH